MKTQQGLAHQRAMTSKVSMIIIICLLLSPIIISSQKLTQGDLTVIPTSIDTLTEQSVIDEAWEDCMIKAPATINLLGQIMVVASKVDVSFYHYSPDRVYKYIKYPKSFRATLLQISNEGYQAFLGSHKSMNRIQLYMQQIPQHVKTIIKLLSRNAEPQIINRLLPKLINNIERIGKICVTLSSNTEKSFESVMQLLAEVLEATEETRGLHEKELHDKDVELNVTRILHVDMKREEEIRRQRFEEIRESVRKAQQEYSRALDKIPIGFKAFALDLGRACISIIKVLSSSFVSNRNRGSHSSMGRQQSGSSGGGQFANEQTINFASRFADSLSSLIQRIPSNENQTINKNELKSFKVIFETFANLINNIPNNKAKHKAVQLVQNGIQLVDKLTENENSNIKDDLVAVADDAKSFTAAEQLSSTNNAPISVPAEGDSSKNELFKAQLAQVRLSETEKRLDEHYANHLAAIEQMRLLTAKLASLDLTVIHFKQILEMLREALRLLGLLRKHWHELVDFFSDLAAKVEAGFGETLKTFIDTASVNIDPEKAKVGNTIILELLNGESVNLYRESYTLFIMSRTYFDVSKKYIMPRLAGLSLMLTAENDQQRHQLLSELQRNTQETQTNVTKLVHERKRMYKKIISEKRAQINEKIDEQGADNNELDIIKEGKMLLENEDFIDE